MFADVLRDIRFAIRQLTQEPGLHRRRGPDAGARHRRHERDLQRRQRRAAAAAAVSRAGRAGAGERDRAAIRPLLGRAGDVPRLARSRTPCSSASRRTPAAARRSRGRERRRAGRERVGVLGHLRAAAASRPALGRGVQRPKRTRRARTTSSCSATACGSGASAATRTSSGASITLSGAPVTIVGVMPPDFYFPARRRSSGGRSRSIRPNASRGGHFLGVIARLKPGVSQRRRPAAEMKTIAERLAQQYPDTSANESAEVVAAARTDRRRHPRPRC